MIKVKGNYKNGHRNLKCRVCVEKPETQQHILTECEKLHPDASTKATSDNLFTEDPETLKKTALKIDLLIKKVEQ